MLYVFDFTLTMDRSHSDLQFVSREKVGRSKVDHLIVASPDNVAHCSHVGGFVGGLGVFCV